jgi:hypothetical protein
MKTHLKMLLWAVNRASWDDGQGSMHPAVQLLDLRQHFHKC